MILSEFWYVIKLCLHSFHSIWFPLSRSLTVFEDDTGNLAPIRISKSVGQQVRREGALPPLSCDLSPCTSPNGPEGTPVPHRRPTGRMRLQPAALG